MELCLESDLYAPMVNDQGIYIDNIPCITNGIRCPCNARKDKVYTTRQLFTMHIKTKAHAKWLQDMNNNRANFFVENIRLNETIKTQQQIIAKLETDLQNKLLAIDYLTQMLTINQQSMKTGDLLELN